MNKIVYNGWHKVEELEASIKGRIVKREKLIIKSAVAALITDTKGKVALVKQYRPCTGESLYEIPAGVLDKEGLTPKQIILEELQEECELDAKDVVVYEEIAKYYMLAGSSDATTTIFRIKYNGIGCNKIVDDVDVESVEWFSVKELNDMIKAGVIKDAKTIIGLNSI